MRLPSCIALIFLLAACTPDTKLGTGAPTPYLQGRVTQERIFVGGPLQDHTVIAARNLVPGQSYEARGMLTVTGDVPADTDITVELGRLVVNGNVGAGSTLRANVPLVTHSEFAGCWQRSMGLGYGPHGDFRYGMGYGFGPSYGYGRRFDDCTQTVVDGQLYDDPSPAILVRGQVAPGVRLLTQGRIAVGGAEWPNPGFLPPYRPR